MARRILSDIAARRFLSYIYIYIRTSKCVLVRARKADSSHIEFRLAYLVYVFEIYIDMGV